MKKPSADSYQINAINHGSGPALVLAGPGSGKTYIITHRIQNLILKKSVAPGQILVITFTRKAAGEMRERFLSLDIPGKESVVFGTFHSIYYNFLKIYYPGKFLKIIEPQEIYSTVSQIITHNKIYSSSIYFAHDNIEELVKAVSYYKATGFVVPDGYPEELFKTFIDEYSECLTEKGKMDYDDILLECNKMLSVREDIRLSIRKRFKYILADEFQDINTVQYEALIKLSSEERNIFVVGDDDQSIYGFRGSSGMIMSRFLRDFEGTTIYRLKYNYRSPFSIMDPAEKVISVNPERMKDYVQLPASDRKGVFEIKICDDINEQVKHIKNILNQKDSGKVAILVRTNNDIYEYKTYLSEKNNNFNRDEIETMVYETVAAYVSFAINNDRESIIEVIKSPEKMLSRNIFVEEYVDLKALSRQYSRSYKGAELAVLARHFDILKNLNPFAFVNYIFSVAGLSLYFRKKLHEKEIPVWEDIKSDILNKSKSISNLNELLEICIKKKGHVIKKDENIPIMTFHASKGLEFDTVIIPDVNEGKIPGRSLKRGEIDEEERRLFYVAMTRAVNNLYIMAIKNEGTNHLIPSRFIIPLLEDYCSSNSISSRYSSNLSYTASSSSSSSI